MSGDAPSTSSSNVCEICQENISKYCCPRCETLYCSLDCYKSEKHSQCSESFYRDCVNNELATLETGDEDRKKMVDILKRMHLSENDEDVNLQELLQNVGNIDSHFSDSDDGDEIDLHERIKDLNLENPDEIWKALTADERNEFEALVNQGDVSSFIPLWEPWWMYNDEDKPVQELSQAKKEEERALKNCPAIKSVPKLDSMTKIPPSPTIKLNLTNVIAAYAFINRYFNGELEPVETAACLLNICSNLDVNANFDDPEMALESVAQRCLQSNLIQTDEASLDVMVKDTFLIIQGPSKENQTYYSKATISHLHKIFTEAKNKLKNNAEVKTEAQKEKGVFSKKFPDAKSEYLPKIDIVKVKKCIKKIEYYLSYVENHGMIYD